MTDYTPGPWTIGELPQKVCEPPIPATQLFNEPFYSLETELGTICHLYVDNGPCLADFDNAKANAELIASAPRLKEERGELLEMLKANIATLKEQADRFEYFDKGHEEIDQAIKETRELIAEVEK